MPFFFETDDEAAGRAAEARRRCSSRSSRRRASTCSCWGTGGWVQLFSKKPLKTLADVKNAKLYTSKGDDEMVQWYASNGFHPVALLPTDIPAQLKLGTGMIDAAPSRRTSR